MATNADLISFNWTLVMNWVTIIVLFLVLKHFFFDKVHNFVIARQDAVKDVIDNAEATNRRADEKLDAYNKRIAGIEGEGREIIKNAKLKAESQAADILDEANKRAEALLDKALKEIEREKAQAITDMKNQIVALSLMAAEKIMEKDLEATGQDAFIDKIIEQAGTSGWRN
ncbi:MAG: F0F1 ATP synthase subunit B [Clostridiales bacterium]|nr:F0F1 ATP synthase subunit B [Clostridiales bacterium]